MSGIFEILLGHLSQMSRDTFPPEIINQDLGCLIGSTPPIKTLIDFELVHMTQFFEDMKDNRFKK